MRNDGNTSTMTEDSVVFFFRHQLKPDFWYNGDGDGHKRRIGTVRIWDRITWNRHPLNLSTLESVLEGSVMVDSTCLEIVCDETQSPWKAMPDSIWNRFCELLQRHLPNIKRLHLHYPHALGDSKCKVLLKHLPSHLTHLELAFVKGDLPETLQALGGTFPSLEELKMAEYDELTVNGGKQLASSLRQLTKLQKISLRNFSSENVKDVARPIFDAIRCRSHLKEVSISGLWHNYIGSGREPVYWLAEEVDALQFGPRLNQVQQEFLSKESLSLPDFVNALISVRDRVDCLDHIISKVDPNLYAKQAIGMAGED